MKKKGRRKIPSLNSIDRAKEKRWQVSEEEVQIFLQAVEKLKKNRDDLLCEKLDFTAKKSFTIRKRRDSFREPGEKIQAILDLHGFGLTKAVSSLYEFCRQSAKRGLRTIMIITGKGIHSKDRSTVLRDGVIQWLNTESGKDLVEFYRLGDRRQGGSGALILYLYQGE